MPRLGAQVRRPIAAAAALFVLAFSVGTAEIQAQERRLPPARTFAPGVLTEIPIELSPADTVSVHDVIEIRSNKDLEWDPKLAAKSRTLYGKADDARFRRSIWCLEFSFKPLRMIWVDVPDSQGVTRRELIWYLVYRIRNTGETLAPVPEEGKETFAATIKKGGPVQFLPHFVLQGHDLDANGKPLYRAYLDQIVPAAIEPIRRRELPGRTLLSNVGISEEPIPAKKEGEVWGVTTWRDIDPEMDFFSVFVRGLTNAYRWADQPDAYQPGDPIGKGRTFAYKTLQLNFWRPGDQFLEHESEVRFGIAPDKASLYGVKPGVAYRWVYR